MKLFDLALLQSLVKKNSGGGSGGGTKLYQHDIHVNIMDVTHVYYRIITDSPVEMFFDTAENAIQTEMGSNIIASYVRDYYFGYKPMLLSRSNINLANDCYDVIMGFGLSGGSNSTLGYVSYTLLKDAFMVSNMTSFTDTVTEL